VFVCLLACIAVTSATFGKFAGGGGGSGGGWSSGGGGSSKGIKIIISSRRNEMNLKIAIEKQLKKSSKVLVNL
jgi:hypothetical protein